MKSFKDSKSFPVSCSGSGGYTLMHRHRFMLVFFRQSLPEGVEESLQQDNEDDSVRCHLRGRGLTCSIELLCTPSAPITAVS